MSVLLLVSLPFKSLLGLKVAFRVAAMLMASPVPGFRPIRAFVSFTSKLPNPRKSTFSPDARLSATIFRIASRIGRGRDRGYPLPPAQTRAGAASAHGSYLG
jgi:hypothetical protein